MNSIFQHTSMKLTGTQTFPVPRQQVWAFLTDPQCLAKCMPGCEKLEPVGENEYSGIINVGLAAVKGVYNGKVKLDEMRPPTHYKMVLDGKGKQGFIKGSGTIDLEEQNGQTLLKYSGDVQIGGPLASVGQRIVCKPVWQENSGVTIRENRGRMGKRVNKEEKKQRLLTRI